VPVKNFLGSSAEYAGCNNCGKSFHCSKQWIDKSTTCIITDYFPIECEQSYLSETNARE